MDDQIILDLKAKGKSLRGIASVLGISHEAVRKRLKNLEGKVSTIETERKLTASTIKKEKVSTGSNVHQSRTSEEIKDTVNQVSTPKTPSVSLNEGVNLSETPSDKLPDVSQEVRSEVDSLSEQIKEFLESKGIELYRLQVEPEAYQVSLNNQVIRFYVQMKQTGESQIPQDGLEVGRGNKV